MSWISQALIDFLWPQRCALCGGPGAVPLCAGCGRGLALLPAAERVREWAPGSACEASVSVGPHQGEARELLLRWKYARETPAGAALLQWWEEHLPPREALRHADAVVALPLSARHRRTRGFNQAEDLARCVAARHGLPLLRHALARRGKARAQAGLSGSARRRNLAGSFAASGVFARALVLVDDVVTTGTTLGRAAEALRAAGARRVVAWTLLRAHEAEALGTAPARRAARPRAGEIPSSPGDREEPRRGAR